MGVLQTRQIHDRGLAKRHQLRGIFGRNARIAQIGHANVEGFPGSKASYRRHILSRLGAAQVVK